MWQQPKMLSVYGTQSSKAPTNTRMLIVWCSLTVWLLWEVEEPSQQVNRAAAPPLSLSSRPLLWQLIFPKTCFVISASNKSAVNNNIIFYIQLYGMNLWKKEENNLHFYNCIKNGVARYGGAHPLTPACRVQRQGIWEFEANLLYIASFRLARATQTPSLQTGGIRGRKKGEILFLSEQIWKGSKRQL